MRRTAAMEDVMSRLLVGFVRNLIVSKSLDFAPFGMAVAGALALVWVLPVVARAQGHEHGGGAQSNGLVQVVRDATARFKNVEAAENEDYHLLFGCVSGPDSGAMGLHYVNLSLVMDGELDPMHPEIVLYEALPNGRLKLTGADFLVLADAWDTAHPGETPQLMGQLLHRFDAPNRFGLPPFYTLHVWAWKESPTGTFVNWHSNTSCDSFNPQ